MVQKTRDKRAKTLTRYSGSYIDTINGEKRLITFTYENKKGSIIKEK